METEAGILSCEIPKPEPVKRIGLLNFQTGSITIMGAGPGDGKSSTIIKVGAHNSVKGDGRPMMIFTKEQKLNNLVLPMWSRFGGRKHGLYYPTLPGYKLEQIPWEKARPQVLKACATGEFAFVFLDLVYLTVNDENKNKEYEKVLLEIQGALQFNTCFVATAHLKKDVKDQPLVHHLRGGTDMVGIPDRVLYLRRGKQKSERVIVNLKDRYTGDLSGGWITSMPQKDGDMEIRAVEGNPKSILATHAEGLVSEQRHNSQEAIKEHTLEIIRRQVTSFPNGMWDTTDYLSWAKEIMNLGENRAKALLWQAGFYSKKPKGAKHGKYKIFARLGS